jgi:hypothetical protein
MSTLEMIVKGVLARSNMDIAARAGHTQPPSRSVAIDPVDVEIANDAILALQARLKRVPLRATPSPMDPLTSVFSHLQDVGGV